MKSGRKKGRKVLMRAKLVFDEGFAEKPVYRIKAFVSEKRKGLDMMDLIQKNFSITDSEWRNRYRENMKDVLADPDFFNKDRKVVWSRDEKGNIASPFRSNRKL